MMALAIYLSFLSFYISFFSDSALRMRIVGRSRAKVVFALDESNGGRVPINQDSVALKRGEEAPNSLFSLNDPTL